MTGAGAMRVRPLMRGRWRQRAGHCLALALAVLVAACAGAARPDADSTAAQPAPAAVLYFTCSAGYQHEVVPLSEQILRELGERSGTFRVTVSHDPAVLNAKDLARFEALVFYTTGELPISAQQKADLLAFVENGKGFVGIHSASDTFYQWPEYGRLLGGYFDQHPWNEEVTVTVEDRSHPATRHLGESFVIGDEIYQFKDWSRDDVHVLLSLDTASVEPNDKVHRRDGDFALAWTREPGKGRVFHSALGHRPEVWRDPRFQQFLVGGIEWAMGE